MVYHPLVSIVIPVYNGANYMREAIDSALSQTYDNIEIIVVNDGSRDNGETEKIALSYGDKIKYFKKENGGCASALNFGISKMNGEYFSWLSHDDVYLPDKVKKQVDCINEKNLDHKNTIVSCEAFVINAEGKTIRQTKADYSGLISGTDAFRKILLGKSFNGCALLIPKNVLDAVGEFSTSFVYILDWEYWVKIALGGSSFYCMSEHLVKNRRHNEQVSVKKKELRDTEVDRHAKLLCDRLCCGEYPTEQLRTFFVYCAQLEKKDESGRVKVELEKRNAFVPSDSLTAQRLAAKRKTKDVLRVVYRKAVLGIKR